MTTRSSSGNRFIYANASTSSSTQVVVPSSVLTGSQHTAYNELLDGTVSNLAPRDNKNIAGLNYRMWKKLFGINPKLFSMFKIEKDKDEAAI